MSGRPESPFERRDFLGLALTLIVILAAVPAAILVLPNTASYVAPQATRDLGLGAARAVDLVRACGLALPAMLVVTPVFAAAARRLPPWAVLLAGLAVLLGAQAAAPYATSLPVVAAVRVAEGAGAGAVLPATLVLAWQVRQRATATGMLAAALTGTLLLATPLALAATPAPDAPWRTILRPYWWLSAVALIGAGLLGLRRPHRPAAARRGERTQLLLPAVPAAGFAFLAVVTTYDWSTGAQLVLAAASIAGLLGLASVGSGNVLTGSPLACAVVMVAVGLLTMPVTGPLAGLLGGRSVPQAPFAAAAASAALAALAAAALGRDTGRAAVLCGYGMSLVAVLLLMTMGTADRWTPLVALCVLGTGAGMATGAALRHTEPSAAVFGLSLCFPAVLGGHLIVGPLQIARVGAVTRAGGGTAEALFALTAAYRLWLVTAGVIIVVLAATTAWVSRNSTVGSQRRAEGTAPP
jgi:hypothetical protein